MSEVKKIPIKDVKKLLADGKSVKVKSRNGEFHPVLDYFEKGTLKTYQVKTSNGYSIKTSAKHKFFTSQGWMSTDELKPNITKIYCDDEKYHTVSSVDYIGEHPIVDIEVGSEEHSYFGNGMMNHNSGKSLMSAHLLANTQKKGGVAVYIDTENSVSQEYLRAIGIDVDKLLYVSVDTVERIFETIETIVEKVRTSDKDRLVTIVVDSVAAASTEIEMDSDYGKDGYATQKALIMSKSMRKITGMIGKQNILLVFTNQLREKLGVMFGDKYCVDPMSTELTIQYSEDSPFYREYHNKLKQIKGEVN